MTTRRKAKMIRLMEQDGELVQVRDSTPVERLMDKLIAMVQGGPNNLDNEDSDCADYNLEQYQEWKGELQSIADELQHEIKLEQCGKIIRRP